MTSLPERLRWAREKRGYSCAGLDELAGLSCGHVAKIERGYGVDGAGAPSTTTVARIANALRVEATWLLFGGRRPRLT